MLALGMGVSIDWGGRTCTAKEHGHSAPRRGLRGRRGLRPRLPPVASGLAGGLFARLMVISLAGRSGDWFSRFRQKAPVRFAAGCGLAAIAAIQAGAASAEVAEIDPLALAASRLNATLNGVALTYAEGAVVGAACRWDIILAGDVCYEAPMTAHILPWLRAMAAAGAEVWIADPGRAYLPRDGLSSIGIHHVPTSLELEDRAERVVTIARLSP